MTLPERTPPNYANCYASLLGGCAGPMSKEHYISRCILEDWGKMFTIAGAPGLQQGQTRPMTARTGGSRVLCKDHNSALSELDTEARAWLAVLGAATIGGGVDVRTTGEVSSVHFLDGMKIQRWMLKALCGLLSSRSAPTGYPTPRAIAWTPNSHWIRIVFGLDPMPEMWGLYLAPSAGGLRPVPGFRIAPMASEDDVLQGMRLDTFGLSWFLVMADRGTYGGSDRFELLVHRPHGMTICRPTGDVYMWFTWTGEFTPLEVVFVYDGPHPCEQLGR